MKIDVDVKRQKARCYRCGKWITIKPDTDKDPNLNEYYFDCCRVRYGILMNKELK